MAGINVNIGADSSKAERELKSFERKTKKIASSIAKGFKERIGHKLFDGLAGAARQIPGFLNDAVQSASSLNEEIGKSKAVFGKSSDQILSWAKTTTDSLGLSQLAALKSTGEIGNLMKAFGFTGKEAAEMSQRLVELAVDMSSFNDVPVEQTLTAVAAAMRGEKDAIQKLGASFDDADLKARAFAMGIADGKTTLTANQKALAAYNIILEQTENQHGNFTETSDDLANAQKRLKAQFEDASAAIGKGLLPAMLKLVEKMNEIDWQKFGEDVGGLAESFVGLTSSIGDSLAGLRMLKALKTGNLVEFARIRQEEIEKQTGSFDKNLTEAGKILNYGTAEEKQALIDKLNKEEEEAKKNKDIKAKVAENKEAKKEEEKEEEKLVPKQTFGLIAAKMRKRGPEDLSKDEEFMSELDRTRDQLDAASFRSSTSAVSSMQRIGGGGGAYGELDLQRKQADLQGKMVTLLQDIKNSSTRDSISDF